jgi:hypothetical protein
MLAGIRQRGIDVAPVLSDLGIDIADIASRIPVDRYAALYNRLNRLLDERGIVEGQLKREYAAWEKLVDEEA